MAHGALHRGSEGSNGEKTEGQMGTVDGSEIRRSLVDMVSIPLFTGFHTCWMVQDVFHEQYQYVP